MYYLFRTQKRIHLHNLSGPAISQTVRGAERVIIIELNFDVCDVSSPGPKPRVPEYVQHSQMEDG